MERVFTEHRFAARFIETEQASGHHGIRSSFGEGDRLLIYNTPLPERHRDIHQADLFDATFIIEAKIDPFSAADIRTQTPYQEIVAGSHCALDAGSGWNRILPDPCPVP